MAEDRPQPPRPFFEVQDEVRRLFQELIHQPWGTRSPSATTGWQPSCDMAETTEAIIVEVELPGVERQDVHIEVEGNVLRISGERHSTVEHQERQYCRIERIYGVISLNRPMSTEAAAGKNPVSHVGKIYTLLSHQMAQHIYTTVDGVAEVYVWLCSQIGQPVDCPWMTAAQVILRPGASLADVHAPITEILHTELAMLPRFIEQLTRGALPVW